MINRVILSSDKEYVHTIVSKALYDMGFPRHLIGYTYLCQAVTEIICGYDCYGITKKLYPYIARLNNTSAVAVERSIRVAIRKVCDMGGDGIREISNCADGTLHFSNREFILVMAGEIQKRFTL